MSTSPTPEEREKKDAEAKAREAEEQAKLPYKWTQTIGDVDITIPVPGNLKGRDLDIVMTKTKIKAGVKGQKPIVDVCIRFSSVTTHRCSFQGCLRRPAFLTLGDPPRNPTALFPLPILPIYPLQTA